MNDLIPKKCGAAIINIVLLGLYFAISKKVFLHLCAEEVSFVSSNFLTFNLYFLLTQIFIILVMLFYYKMQGSLGYICVFLKVKEQKTGTLSLKYYIIRCLPFFLFQLGMVGVQFDTILHTKSVKGLLYGAIGTGALLFIIINSISIFFSKGISFVDILSKTEVVARYFNETKLDQKPIGKA